jgi:hypothetical protein
MATKTAANKPANRWLDVQIVVATLAMTLTLFMWNIFAGSSRLVNTGTVTNPQTASVPNANPAQSSVRILFGSQAPQAASISNPPSRSSAPAPVVVTGSSRP